VRRYLLFAGEHYYPQGGAEDLVGDFDTLEEAWGAAPYIGNQWRQVLDLETGEKHACPELERLEKNAEYHGITVYEAERMDRLMGTPGNELPPGLANLLNGAGCQEEVLSRMALWIKATRWRG
jgi:hypothetical protein